MITSRIKIFKAHLEKVQKQLDKGTAQREFNMGAFGIADMNNIPEPTLVMGKGGKCTWQLPKENLNAGTCGTAACALGEACYIPEFIEHGLHMTFNTDGGGSVHFKGEMDFEAGQKFFGLTSHQSYELFSPNKYYDHHSANIEPRDVIEKLDKLLAGHNI